MGVSVVGTEVAYHSDTTALALSPHGSTAIGDVLIGILGVDTENGVRSGGAGFTLEAEVYSGDNRYSVLAFSKLVESLTAITSYSFGNTNGTRLTGAMVTLRGVNTTDVVSAITTWQSATTTETAVAQTVTASYSSCVMLAVFGCSIMDANWTAPVSMTEVADTPYADLESAQVAVQLSVCWESVNAGATGTRTAILTDDPAKRPVTISMLLQPRVLRGAPLFFGINT